MADVQALKSYLVALGFEVNQTQLTQFNNALKSAATVVESNTNSIVGNIAKWYGIIVGAFTAVSGAVIATADKVAMADQDFRLLGERMFMNTQHARSMQMALNVLGATLEQVAFDPELHQRFMELQQLQGVLSQQLGPDFERNMRGIRDIRFEFSRLRIEMQYFAMQFVSKLFEALGGEKFIERLRAMNDYIVRNLPYWSSLFVQYIVPVLKDTWEILKGLWQLVEDLATLFTNIVGLLSGDTSIMGMQFKFENFAAAVGKVVWLLAKLIELLHVLGGTVLGAGAGAAIGGLIGGPAGAGIGALIGGGAGAVFDAFRGAARQEAGGEAAPGLSIGMGTGDLERMAASVAHIESGGHQTDRFGRTITSSAGALGIMQLMPSTAKALGVDPYNAAENMAGGKKYLAQLYSRYGNWHDALAAYNWGPGNVDAALRAHHAFPASVEHYAQMGIAGYNRGGVTIGQINITQPNASADQIADAIHRRIQQEQGSQTASHLKELRSIYG